METGFFQRPVTARYPVTTYSAEVAKLCSLS